MARKFLYFIAAMVVLLLAVLAALRIWADDLTEMAFVPQGEFREQPPLAIRIYDQPAMWYARPGMGAKDPARWLPAGLVEDGDALAAAVFFIHPTSYLDREHWNAPLDHADARARAELFVKSMASPFNKSPNVWAPRYRQAAYGAFLSDAPEAERAIDAAYRDVVMAFERFAASLDQEVPIVLAGHSQGSFHLKRLLAEHLSSAPLKQRIVAAYIIGWPVSLDGDLEKMGLPACAEPEQTGCVVSWLSFADPADPGMLRRSYSRHPAIAREAPEGGRFLCTNPLTGRIGGDAPASANLGTLVPNAALTSGTIRAGMVPARCSEDGLLHIGDPPELGPFVLPGNNYHVYDIPLFWANLRADVARRTKAWKP